jgi:hypothetical protein
MQRPTVKPRLGVEQVEMMFAHIFRLPEVTNLAFADLRPELFYPGTEAHYMLLWQAAVEVYQKQGAKAFETHEYAYAVLEIEILTSVRARPGSLNAELYDKLFSRTDSNPGLLYWIFNLVKPAELTLAWGKQLVRDFRLEREVSDMLQTIVAGAGGNIIVDLPETLRKLSDQYVSITAQGSDRAMSGAPEGWTPKPMHKFPTNIDFIDKFLKGGHAGGEAYGVLGAYASGKTALAVQIAYRGARLQLEMNANDPTYRAKDWFIFTYEATFDEILVRLWSNACTIDHAKLEEFNWDKLTTGANGESGLDRYEKLHFAKDIKQQIFKGEKERLEDEMPMFRVNFWVHDMTGTGENPKKGTGYVPEIKSLIQAELNELSRRDGWKHEVGGVVIDYAGLCAKRFMTEHDVDLNHLRHYVGDFGYKCKTELAVPFNCPVWVFHQLDTKSNKKKMKTLSSHADAAEAKNFGENLVFCFELGTKDAKTNTLYMNCSKARRAQIGRSPLLQIEGKFFRFRRAPGIYEVNSAGEVCKKSDLSISTTEHTAPPNNQESEAPPAPEEVGKGYNPSNPDMEFS